MNDGSLVFDTGIDPSGFQAGKRVLESVISGFGFDIEKSLTAVLGKMIDFGQESIELASDIQEVQNVTDVTFGKNAAKINAWSKTARTQYGLTELQAKKFTGTIGSMFKSMGLTEKEVYNMSTSIVGLSADMASFYNLDHETMFTKIRSGIAGEVEPLRQLGINMSVANLEAFAFSKGIESNFKDMDQSEQALLRYQYLLNATMDAQGDFKRTSTSYANTTRTLQTNVDTLKQNLGELLLPVANSVVGAVNNIFTAMNQEETLSSKIQTIDQNFNASVKNIEDNQVKAESLLQLIESLEGRSVLNTEETIRYRGAVDGLIEIYPQLQQYIDTTTGKFTISASAIRDETQAIAQNALAKARAAANEEKLAAAAKAVVDAEDKFAKSSKEQVENAALAQERYETFVGKQLELNAKLSQAYEELRQTDAGVGLVSSNGFSDTMASVEEYMREGLKFATAFRTAVGVPNDDMFDDFLKSEVVAEIDSLSSEVASASKDFFTFSEAAEKAGAEVATYSEELTQAQEVLSGIEEDIKGQAEAITELGVALEESGVKTYSEDVAEAIASARENIVTEADQINQRLAQLVSEVRGNMDGVAKGFNAPEKVKAPSAKDALANLKKQLEAINDYQANLEKLKEKGASDELLASLSGGTAEDMANAASFAKASEKSLTEISEAYQNVQNAKDEVAEYASSNLAKVDEEVTGAAEKVKSLAEEINTLTGEKDSITKIVSEAIDPAQTATDGLITNLLSVINKSSSLETVKTGAEDAKTAVSEVQEEGDKMGSSTWTPTMSVNDFATAVLKTIKTAYDDIKSKTVTLTLNYKIAGTKPALLKKGLNYIPFDEFPAMLHEGEAVLTKEEANLWRAGRTAIGGHVVNVANSPSEMATANQTINFYVPVQTPDEFAQTMQQYATYGLEGAFG